MRHPSLPVRRLSLLTLALAGLACDDTTAPRSPERPSIATDVAAAQVGGTVTVHPGDLHGWTFAPTTAGSACADPTRCRFVSGPATPPLGTASVELAPTRTSAATMELHAFGGTRLDHLTALAYSVYLPPLPPEGDDARGRSPGLAGDERRDDRADDGDDAEMTLALNVDFDLTNPSHTDVGQLVPATTADGERGDERRASTGRGAWQRRDARAGRWWARRTEMHEREHDNENRCVRSSPCTWAQLLKRFPNVGLHDAGGTVALVAPRGRNLRVNVDDVEIGVNGVTTIYDFETTPPTPQLLTVLSDRGVGGSPAESDSGYRYGAAVAYDFRPPTDGRTLSVYLDGAIVPAAGTVHMTAPHTLLALLRTDLSLRPDDQPVFDAVRAVLASADPVPTFQSLVDLAGRSYAELGEAATDARFARATAAAIDPVRDSAALHRVNDALGGRLFDVNIPPDGPAMSRHAPSAPVRRRSSMAVAPTNRTAEPTTIVYVNGIGNLFVDAARTQAHLGYLLRRNVYRFRDTQDIVLRLVYNRNDATVNPPRGVRACLVEAVSPGILTALPRYLSCRAFGPLGPILGLIADLREAVSIMSGKALPTAGPVLQDIHALASAMQGWAESGRSVVVMPHSEGNLITERALVELQSSGFLTRNGRPYCIAVAPMASPTVHYGPVGSAYLRPVQLEGDAILLASRLPTGAESFPASATPLNSRLAAARAVNATGGNTSFLRELLDGGEIHSMDSYLSAEGGRDLVLAAAEDAYNACATGYVSITGSVAPQFPGQYAMLLGSTVQFSVSAVNGAGDTLVGKPVTWSADDGVTTVTPDGLASAIALGSTGYVGAQVGWQYVRVMTVPFSNPPVINSVSCIKGDTRYEGRSMITRWSSTIDAAPSTPLAPIKGYQLLLEVKLTSGGTDRLSTINFATQTGSSASTEVSIAQTILMNGIPEGGQWIPTGRCLGRVTDSWGKKAEMYSP